MIQKLKTKHLTKPIPLCNIDTLNYGTFTNLKSNRVLNNSGTKIM